LLQKPNHYTDNYNFVQINLWWLRQYVRSITELIAPSEESFLDIVGDEQCTYETDDKVPTTRFDNYKCRGPLLANLSLFEYLMLVQTRRLNDAIQSDIEFEHVHPKSGVYVQRLAVKKSQLMTVTYNGQLSQFQKEEDSIHGGHTETASIRNDVSEILLGPWNQLPLLFQQHATT
jgi:hypothetical protein